MPFLNLSLKDHIYCYVRDEYLHNMEECHGDTTPCAVFGVASVPGRALGFHVMTDRGAVFWRLPVSALCHDPRSEPMSVEELQLWDCFGDTFTETTYDFLSGLRCTVRLPVGDTLRPFKGTYVTTIDWTDNGYSDAPDQNKCGHLIALDNGNYAIQPNNRIFWREASFTTNPITEKPTYKTNTHVWQCEAKRDWVSEDTDEFFYE